MVCLDFQHNCFVCIVLNWNGSSCIVYKWGVCYFEERSLNLENDNIFCVNEHQMNTNVKTNLNVVRVCFHD